MNATVTPFPRLKREGGRPRYMSEFADRARELCRLGATSAYLARVFNVSESTIQNWLRFRDDFAQAVKEGREDADREVVDSLFQLARGFSYTDVVISPEGAVQQIQRYVPPDYRAAALWLQGRQPETFGHLGVKVPGEDEQPHPEAVTIEQEAALPPAAPVAAPAPEENPTESMATADLEPAAPESILEPSTGISEPAPSEPDPEAMAEAAEPYPEPAAVDPPTNPAVEFAMQEQQAKDEASDADPFLAAFEASLRR